MEPLQLRYWDDPVLSKICDPVRDTEYGSKLEEFGQQMIKTMDANKGVGLAASQVGVLSNLFVMRFPCNTKREPLIVCNPTLDLDGALVYAQEGCLSLPGIFEKVERSQQVTMRFFHPNGAEDVLSLVNMDARVVQHEFDHTRGVMFFNRVSRQSRRAMLAKYQKICG